MTDDLDECFPRRNIELKARCRDLAAARSGAVKIGAAPCAVLCQLDTYFHASHRRLKLRETVGAEAQLISYARPDHPDARASDYHLVSVPDPSSLKAALSAALGVSKIVRKRRELLMWHNVRIHLDKVDGLGTFIEFEAVLSDSDDEPLARERLAMLAQALAIKDEDRLAGSYSDLAG